MLAPFSVGSSVKCTTAHGELKSGAVYTVSRVFMVGKTWYVNLCGKEADYFARRFVPTMAPFAVPAPHPYTIPVAVPVSPYKANAESYKDKTKAPMSELLAVQDALAEVAGVFNWAVAKKGYSFKQFEKLDPAELRDATQRHLFQTGLNHREKDDESEKLHAIHMAASALMYLQNLLAAK